MTILKDFLETVAHSHQLAAEAEYRAAVQWVAEGNELPRVINPMTKAMIERDPQAFTAAVLAYAGETLQ